MPKKLKMKIRGYKEKGVIGVWCDDVVNGLIAVETKGVGHKTVKFKRPLDMRREGHEGASTMIGRGTRKVK